MAHPRLLCHNELTTQRRHELMELGQQLKEHRKELGISQDELAERIFVS